MRDQKTRLLTEKDALQAVKCAGLAQTRLYSVDPFKADQNLRSAYWYVVEIVAQEADADEGAHDEIQEQVFTILTDEAQHRGYQDWDDMFRSVLDVRRGHYE